MGTAGRPLIKDVLETCASYDSYLQAGESANRPWPRHTNILISRVWVAVHSPSATTVSPAWLVPRAEKRLLIHLRLLDDRRVIVSMISPTCQAKQGGSRLWLKLPQALMITRLAPMISGQLIDLISFTTGF